MPTDLVRFLGVIVTALQAFVWANMLWAALLTDRDARRRAKARAEQRALDRLFAPPEDGRA